MATDFNDGLSICTLKQESFVIDVKGESSLKTKGTISFIAKNHLLIKEEEGDKIIDKKSGTLYNKVENWQLSPEGYLILDLENKMKIILKL